MNIALIYHKHPYTPNPRGGELSVCAIIAHLREKGHHIALANGPSPDVIKAADVVLTWGAPASETAKVCDRLKTPLVLMVRFWKNLAPLPAGNLMNRPVDLSFTATKQHLFSTAKAIITNTIYSKQVIERWQPVARDKIHVSYVPILGEANRIKPGKKITLVTPEIYGENWLVNGLAELMPDEQFLVINAKPLYFRAQHHNIETKSYTEMSGVWKQTKLLLVPVYGNDICGTRRSTIEALKYHLPVAASGRCGMWEKVPAQMLVSADAPLSDWEIKIKQINNNYEQFRELAAKAWFDYDTEGQMEGFERILLNCVRHETEA